ncbi:MAG: DUF296 domain-containing protein [Syntrophorhabdaceae bacterium]|nr:DUF296 domain-containing protein [Syntrophorhabdaceae bacterium]
MKYKTARIGRVFVLQFDDGDPVLEHIIDIVKKEDIKAGILYLVGGIKKADIVVGPERDELPPEPVWRRLTESHETLGIGTIFWHKDEPIIHLHGAYGKKDSTRVGCLRGSADTFIILEGIILELDGIDASREPDPVSGFKLLSL